MYACNGILFNHESPKRGETFVTRKITRGLARIVLGLQECLYLGNLSALRDWGHARDYVEMQWLMLQQDPEDYVIATGRQYSVREFINTAARELGLLLAWEGEGVEKPPPCCSAPSTTSSRVRVIVRVDPRYFRPTEVETLLATHQGPREAGLVAARQFRAAGQGNGRERPEGSPATRVEQNGYEIYAYKE